eukprot:TRINITY_DN16295_c0_g1_i1.p2 TRINITY_DN16295_c0_g1~~TRINITY_DN16295_c0_g1_i1.p2  ORF type:complete len:301 (+),score=97.34 TRINITY_DN16295_c0_g1_i1:100-1002(+)
MGDVLDTAPYLGKWTSVPARYNRRDLVTYAVGIGCTDMPHVYERNRAFRAFPTYPFVLSFKGDTQDVDAFPSKAMKAGEVRPPLAGVKVALDGERRLEWVAPLPKGGAELTLKQRLTGVFRKGSGAAMESETQVVNRGTGELYCKIFSAAFLVGAHGFKDAGVSHFEKLPKITRAPDATAEAVTSPSQALLYRLSGDYNPLHIDAGFAGASGFAAPILHGLCSLGISTRLVLARVAPGADAPACTKVSARFTKPVLPGQTLVVAMWRDGPSRVRFETKVKETNETCIANAFVELAAPAKL